MRVVLILLLMAVTPQKPDDLFQQALMQERGVGNLEEAVKLFERTAKAAADDRTLAANAMLGMARCYEKLGSSQAAAKFDEIIRTYSDQPAQVNTARQRLAFLATTAANFNFESGVAGQAPWGWTYGATAAGASAGAGAMLVEQNCVQGLRCALLTGTSSPAANWSANLFKNVEARSYSGREVRFRAAVRVEGADTSAQMWFRFDHVNGDTSRIEKPIYPGAWDYYTVVGNVTPDTVRITFGVMVHGSGRVWIDDASFIGEQLRKPQ